MLSFSVFKAITLILVLSNILEIEAIKCFQSTDSSKPDPDKVPTSSACEESTNYCKNVTSDDGTLFSCESTLGDDITADDLPKCVESTKTCYCKTDDCNALKPKIKCPVTTGDDKKEQECQHGIVNCKNTTTTTDGKTTTTHGCGNTKADQKSECTGTEADANGKICFFTPMVEETKSSSSKPFIFCYLVQSLVGMLFVLSKSC